MSLSEFNSEKLNNNIENEYKNCNKDWNTIYLVWGVPIINTLIFLSIIILLILIPYIIFGYTSYNIFNFSYFIACISYFYFLHYLTFKRVDNIKKDCFEYGKNIIIPVEKST
jgi:hypothetical protein